MKSEILTIMLALSCLVTRTSIAGSWDTTFSSTFPEGENALCITTAGSDVYVGTDNGNIYLWNPLGSGWGLIWATNTGVGGPIRFIAKSGLSLYIGGTFTSGVNNGTAINLNNVAKVNLSGGTLSALGSGSSPGVTGTIYTMILTPQSSLYRHDFLYVGGVLTAAGGAAAANVASWNGSSWSNMRNGLTFANSSMTTKGVWSLNQFQIPSAPGTTYILATGRFESANGSNLAGPNIARFSEDSSGNSSWSSVGWGLGDLYRDPSTCMITRVQGYDCYISQAVAIGSPATAYMRLSNNNFSHIDGSYQMQSCNILPTACVCGEAATPYTFAKSGVYSGSPATWDGSQGWYPNLSPEWGGGIWSDGGTIYGVISSYGGSAYYIGKYVAGSSSWTAISSAGAAMGDVRTHFMAKSSTAIYIAPWGVPQRWIL